MTYRDATPSHGTSPERTGQDPLGTSPERTGQDPAEILPPGAERTERELRDALEALAGGVLPDPDAYRTARGEWLRRERRRRLVLAVLVAVVFTLATLIGLWVLNQAPADPGVIFSGNGSPSADGPPPRLSP